MAGAGLQLSTKFPHHQIYLHAYKMDQKGHKLPAYMNFLKSPDELLLCNIIFHNFLLYLTFIKSKNNNLLICT